MDENESDLARRVREQANAKFDWSTQARIKIWASPKPKPHKQSQSAAIDKLPPQRAPAPVGAIGRLVPTKHEAAILRRAAQPGAAILITMRQDEPPVFVFEDGTLIRSGRYHDKPMTAQEFERLRQFLSADNDGLFPDGPPQRFTARRVP